MNQFIMKHEIYICNTKYFIQQMFWFRLQSFCWNTHWEWDYIEAAQGRKPWTTNAYTIAHSKRHLLTRSIGVSIRCISKSINPCISYLEFISTIIIIINHLFSYTWNTWQQIMEGIERAQTNKQTQQSIFIIKTWIFHYTSELTNEEYI